MTKDEIMRVTQMMRERSEECRSDAVMFLARTVFQDERQLTWRDKLDKAQELGMLQGRSEAFGVCATLMESYCDPTQDDDEGD